MIVCAGAWTRGLLQGLGVDWPIRLTQEQVTYYATPNLRRLRARSLPDLAVARRRRRRVLRLPGLRRGGDEGGAGPRRAGGERRASARGEPDPERVRRVARFARASCPATPGPELYTRCCLYDMPPDRDFVVDFVPGPAAHRGLHRRGPRRRSSRRCSGASSRELAIDGATAFPIEAFRADRPALADPGFAPGYRLGGRGRGRPEGRGAGRCSHRISSIAEAARRAEGLGPGGDLDVARRPRRARASAARRLVGREQREVGQQRDAGARADELADRGVVVALERHARDEARPRAGARDAPGRRPSRAGRRSTSRARGPRAGRPPCARERMIAVQRELDGSSNRWITSTPSAGRSSRSTVSARSSRPSRSRSTLSIGLACPTVELDARVLRAERVDRARQRRSRRRSRTRPSAGARAADRRAPPAPPRPPPAGRGSPPRARRASGPPR